MQLASSGRGATLRTVNTSSTSSARSSAMRPSPARRSRSPSHLASPTQPASDCAPSSGPTSGSQSVTFMSGGGSAADQRQRRRRICLPAPRLAPPAQGLGGNAAVLCCCRQRDADDRIGRLEPSVLSCRLLRCRLPGCADLLVGCRTVWQTQVRGRSPAHADLSGLCDALKTFRGSGTRQSPKLESAAAHTGKEIEVLPSCPSSTQAPATRCQL